MALFTKSSPEKTLQASLDGAKASRDKIVTRLSETGRTVTEREYALQRLVQAAAPDDDLIIAERALDEIERRQGTLQAGLVQAEVLAEKYERELAELLDAKVRAATSATLLALAGDIEEASAMTVTAMAVLSKAVSRAAFISESAGLAVYASASLVQIPEATQYITGLLKERARLCIAGETSPTLPTPEAPYKTPAVVKPIVRRLFALRAVSWTDANGDLRVAQRWTDVDLPLACADRAIATNACAPMHDKARSQQTLRQWPGHPDPANCFSLDDPNVSTFTATDEHPREPAELHSAFQPLDRGRPYALGVAR
jgi:hypothetical protein